MKTWDILFCKLDEVPARSFVILTTPRIMVYLRWKHHCPPLSHVILLSQQADLANKEASAHLGDEDFMGSYPLVTSTILAKPECFSFCLGELLTINKTLVSPIKPTL